VGLQGTLEDFQKLGAELYAITAEPISQVAQAIHEWKLTYIVVADPEGDAVKEYGLLGPEKRVALPSTFVIDKGGIVRYRYVGTSAQDRPEVKQVLEAVRKIEGAGKP
jgi:thioredoxin-dependent peroxiredoxin